MEWKSIDFFLHQLAWKVKVKVAQLCLTLWDPMDCSLPGFSVHGSLQARILEWIAFPLSRGSSQSWDRTQVSHNAGRFFTSWATREAQEYWSGQPIPLQWSSRSRNQTRVSCIAGRLITNWAIQEAQLVSDWLNLNSFSRSFIRLQSICFIFQTSRVVDPRSCHLEWHGDVINLGI